MNNPFLKFKKRDYYIWIVSVIVILVSNILPGNIDILTLIASIIGVTSLLFAAKGNVWAQILMIVFSIIYGIISYRFRYYGEMITYLGMTLPMSVWSLVTWIKNQSEDVGVVDIRKMNFSLWMKTLFSTIIITSIFYFILKSLDTPNLIFSTISITTSFLAAALMMLRTSFFAAAYAANDVVLIILWTLASMQDASYIPVVVIFMIFLFNDIYGFFSWKMRESKMLK